MNGDLLGLGPSYSQVEEDTNTQSNINQTEDDGVDALAAAATVPFNDEPEPPPAIDFLSGSPIKSKQTIEDVDGNGDNLLGFAQPPPDLHEGQVDQPMAAEHSLLDFAGGVSDVDQKVEAPPVDLFAAVPPAASNSSDPFVPQSATGEFIQDQSFQTPPSDQFAPSPPMPGALQNEPQHTDPFAPSTAPAADLFGVYGTAGKVQEVSSEAGSSSIPLDPHTQAQKNQSGLIPSPEKTLDSDDVQAMVNTPKAETTNTNPLLGEDQEADIPSASKEEITKPSPSDAVTGNPGSVEEKDTTQESNNGESIQLQLPSPENDTMEKAGDGPTPMGGQANQQQQQPTSIQEASTNASSTEPSQNEVPFQTSENRNIGVGSENINDNSTIDPAIPLNSGRLDDPGEQHVKDIKEAIEGEHADTNIVDVDDEIADTTAKMPQQMDTPITLHYGSKEQSGAELLDDTTATAEAPAPVVAKNGSSAETQESNDGDELPEHSVQIDPETPPENSELIQAENDLMDQGDTKESLDRPLGRSEEDDADANEKSDGSKEIGQASQEVSERDFLDEKSDTDRDVDHRRNGIHHGSSLSSRPEPLQGEEDENRVGEQETEHASGGYSKSQIEETATKLEVDSDPPTESSDAATANNMASAENGQVDEENGSLSSPNSIMTTAQEASAARDHGNGESEEILSQRVESLEQKLSAAEALIAELQYTDAEQKHEHNRILAALQENLQKQMTQRAEAEDAARRATSQATKLDEKFAVYDKETSFKIEGLGDDLTNAMKENTAMKDELEQIRAERDEQARNEASLTNRLNSARKKEGEQAHAAEIFEQRTNQLQSELTQTTEKLATLTAERDLLKKDVANWKQFAEEKTKKVDNALKSERKQNDERKKKMKSFVEAKMEEVRLAKSDHLSLQTELDQTNQSLKDLNQRFKQLHTQWVDSQTRCRELQRDITRMKTDSEKLSKVGGAMEAKLSRSAMEAEDHKNKRLAAKNELMAMLRQLETEKEVNNRLRDTIKDTFTTKALSQQQTMSEALDSFEGALQRLALRLNRPVPPRLDTNSVEEQTTNDDGLTVERDNLKFGGSDANTTLLLNKLDTETKRVTNYTMTFMENVDRMNVLVDGSSNRGCVDALQKLIGGPAISSSDERTAMTGLRMNRGPKYGQVPANSELT